MEGRPRGWRHGRARAVVVAAAAALAVLLGAVAWVVLRPASGGGGLASAASIAGPAPDGRPAPELSGPTLAGGTLDLAGLRGSVVLVAVWAAWCAPCRHELPVLVAAERRLHDRGLRLVGIDVRDGARQARDLLAEVGGDPAGSITDPYGRLAAAWQVRGVPETFVVDAAGRVRASHLGGVTADWIREVVVPLLPASTRPG